MKYVKRSFSEIRRIDNEGITFNDGEIIAFKDCIRGKYNSETCVAERDICAMPPYFEFFTPDRRAAGAYLSGLFLIKKAYFQSLSIVRTFWTFK